MCVATPRESAVCEAEKYPKPVGALISSMRIPLISLLKFVSSGYFSFSLAIVFMLFSTVEFGDFHKSCADFRGRTNERKMSFVKFAAN